MIKAVTQLGLFFFHQVILGCDKGTVNDNQDSVHVGALVRQSKDVEIRGQFMGMGTPLLTCKSQGFNS